MVKKEIKNLGEKEITAYDIYLKREENEKKEKPLEFNLGFNEGLKCKNLAGGIKFILDKKRKYNKGSDFRKKGYAVAIKIQKI